MARVLMVFAIVALCALSASALKGVHTSKSTLYFDGYSADNMPSSGLGSSGGWTAWYSGDGPSGEGDKETITTIQARYGSSCSGLPCTESTVAIVEARTKGLSMWSNRYAIEETDDVVEFGRTGLTCLNADQTSGAECHDWEVRFFCTDCQVPECCVSDYMDKLKRFLRMFE